MAVRMGFNDLFEKKFGRKFKEMAKWSNKNFGKFSILRYITQGRQ